MRSAHLLDGAVPSEPTHTTTTIIITHTSLSNAAALGSCGIKIRSARAAPQIERPTKFSYVSLD